MIYPGEAKLKLVNGETTTFLPHPIPFHLFMSFNKKHGLKIHACEGTGGGGHKRAWHILMVQWLLPNKPIQVYSWLHCTDITIPKDDFTSAATKDLQLNKGVKQKIECRLQHQGMDSTCILSRPNKTILFILHVAYIKAKTFSSITSTILSFHR